MQRSSNPDNTTLRPLEGQRRQRMFRRPGRWLPLCAAAALLAVAPAAWGQTNASNAASMDWSSWTNRPLSMNDCVQLALQNNGVIVQARRELEASHGISMQLQSIALPQIKADGDYTYNNLNEANLSTVPAPLPERRWFANIRVIQSLYEGGRIRSSLKAARLTKEQAIADYKAIVADTLLRLRTAYFDTQLAEAQVRVLESSAELLQRQQEDAQRRFETGLVPRFDSLRADVDLANVRPKLFRARNQWRIAKNQLGNLIGSGIPLDVWENVLLEPANPGAVPPSEIELPAAISQALQNRPELESSRKLIAMQEEQLKQSKSGYKPSVKAFTGYGGTVDDIDRELYGWFVGVQMSWVLFDGLQTKGKVKEARARLESAKTGWNDLSRAIEIEVRTAYFSLGEAREVLLAQKKVEEQAEEALRIASSRYRAGEVTQLEVSAAQTALTEVRSATVQAYRDYNVALASLERAMGISTITP